jgi:hypothetical protein
MERRGRGKRSWGRSAGGWAGVDAGTQGGAGGRDPFRTWGLGERSTARARAVDLSIRATDAGRSGPAGPGLDEGDAPPAVGSAETARGSAAVVAAGRLRSSAGAPPPPPPPPSGSPKSVCLFTPLAFARAGGGLQPSPSIVVRLGPARPGLPISRNRATPPYLARAPSPFPYPQQATQCPPEEGGMGSAAGPSAQHPVPTPPAGEEAG